MSHYICNGGCCGVSDNPGSCGAPDCSDHEKPLVECDCEDGNHGAEAEATTESEAEVATQDGAEAAAEGEPEE